MTEKECSGECRFFEHRSDDKLWCIRHNSQLCRVFYPATPNLVVGLKCENCEGLVEYGD